MTCYKLNGGEAGVLNDLKIALPLRLPRNTIGASLSGALANGVLDLEAGYYDSEEDRNGDNPSIENSQALFLISYSRQVGQETHVGFQAYAEWMQDYEAYKRTLLGGFFQSDEIRTIATMKVTQPFLHQTLSLNLFAFLGISDDDIYVIPTLRYAFSDDFWTEFGANNFNGSRNGTFGSLRDNDNIYLTVRYTF